MQTDQRQPEDDPLDQLLAQAHWPEPDAASTQRLRRRWACMQAGEARWTIWRRTLAAAAAVLLAAGAWVAIDRLQRRPVQIVQTTPAVISPLPAAEIDHGRPPTNLELAMLRVIQPVQKKATVRPTPQGVPLIPLVTGWVVSLPAPAPKVRVAPPVNVATLCRVAASSSDAKQRAQAMDDLAALGPSQAGRALVNFLADDSTTAAATAALCKNAGAWTEALFAALDDPRMTVRQAAAKALAQIDGPAVTARLAEMANTSVHYREAVTALVRIHTPQAQQFIADAMHSRELSSTVRWAVAQVQN